MHKKNIIIPALFLLFSFYAFVVFDIGFSGPDEPVYFAYTKSICETGDLNIISEMISENPHFIISPTKNFPDFHPNGGIVFWAPFYMAGKTVFNQLDTFSALTNRYLISSNTMCRMFLSFSNLLMSLVTLVLAFFFARRFVCAKVAAVSVFFIFWASGFFHFALFQTANANIPGTMCAFILYLAALKFKDFKITDWFLFGILCQMCMSIRTELVSALAVLACMWVLLLCNRKVKFSSFPVALAGFLIPLALRAANAWLKFGVIHLEEFSYFNLFGGDWGAQNYNALTSSYRGLLYTCPIFIIAGFGWLKSISQCCAKPRNFDTIYKHTLLILSGLMIIQKLYMLAPLFNPGGIVFNAPRLMLTSLPAITSLTAIASTIIPGLKGVLIWAALCIFSIIWMFLQVCVQLTPFEWFNIVSPIAWGDRWTQAVIFLKQLFAPRQIFLKTHFIPVLLVLVAALGTAVWAKLKKAGNGQWQLKALRVLSIYMLGIYALITLLNLMNNKKNVQRLEKQNFFENSRVATNIDRDTILWAAYEHMRYSILKQDSSRLNSIIKTLDKNFSGEEFLNVEYLKPQNYGFNKLPKDKILKYFTPSINLCLQQIKEKHPNNKNLRMLVSDFYQCTANANASIEMLKPVTNTTPILYNAQRRLLDAYGKAHQHDNIFKQLKFIVKKFPGSYESKINLSESLLEHGQIDEAEKLVDSAIANNPEDQLPYRVKGKILQLKGNITQAEKAYFKALSMATPTDAAIFYEMSKLYKKDGQFELAKAFEQTGRYVRENGKLPYFEMGNETGSQFKKTLSRFVQSKNRPL